MGKRKGKGKKEVEPPPVATPVATSDADAELATGPSVVESAAPPAAATPPAATSQKDVAPKSAQKFMPRAPRVRKAKVKPPALEDVMEAATMSPLAASAASYMMMAGDSAANPTPAEGPSCPMATTVKTVPRPDPEQALMEMVDAMSMGDRRPQMGVGIPIPPRSFPSSCGTLGRYMIVETNHLPLDLSKLTSSVVHYDVSIEPDKPKRLIRPVMRECQRLFYKDRFPAFDGKKNLYASKLLPFGQGMTNDVMVRDEERNRDKEFRVTIKKVNDIDMSTLIKGLMASVPQTAIQALDIILRNAPSNSMVQVGRSFFSQPEGKALDLGDGMEVWIGFFQSAIIGWKPFVNIDVVHKGFPKVQDCVGVITDLNGVRPVRELNPQQKDNFMKYIRELKVDYMVPGFPNTKRTFRVNGIGKSVRDQDFIMDDGRCMTVEMYYAEMKKYKVRYPFLPCLDVGSPLREKKILVPCELCRLVGGQVVIKKMTEKQTSNLIQIAATTTITRKSKILNAMNLCNFNADPSITEFGIKVNNVFQKVTARVLEPPKLQYKHKSLVNPLLGVWKASHFLDGKAIKKWTIVSMDKYVREDNLRAFANQLLGQARQVGMVIDPPQEPINTKILSNETDKLQEFLNRNKHLQMIFVVVQDAGPSYAKVKQIAELTVGVLTQCLKNRTLNRMNPATVGNILLKVNAKLNGTNHMFAPRSVPMCLKVPCMIVGADVTHPPPEQLNLPSVAAVCASHDPKAFKYNLQYRLQPPRMEIIQDLQNIMRQQLLYFYVQTKCKPLKIIFYRDGVSDGQFQEVLNVEFQAIRRACKAVSSNDPKYEPMITFLVVQKRHHTRFFPTSKAHEDCDPKNYNVPAGTIVDTIITHPTDLDFYLVSHASIQGTSRPTKYRRLWDDNNMSEDELELLTYYLCHMFTRCTRSVSYPAPTYYAHLAAYRARCYLEGMRITMTNLPHEQNLRKIKDEIISRNPMFFV